MGFCVVSVVVRATCICCVLATQGGIAGICWDRGGQEPVVECKIPPKIWGKKPSPRGSLSNRKRSGPWVKLLLLLWSSSSSSLLLLSLLLLFLYISNMSLYTYISYIYRKYMYMYIYIHVFLYISYRERERDTFYIFCLRQHLRTLSHEGSSTCSHGVVADSKCARSPLRSVHWWLGMVSLRSAGQQWQSGEAKPVEVLRPWNVCGGLSWRWWHT